MTEQTGIPAPPGFTIDERWQAVADETLRRPPIPLAAPGQCAQLAFLTTATEAEAHRAHIRAFLDRHEARLDFDRPDQIIACTETLTIKWERHTEFCSVTVFTRGEAGPGADASLAAWPPLDQSWIEDCPGRLIVAFKIAVEEEGHPVFAPDFVVAHGNAVKVASRVNGDTATVETSFYPTDDGFMHIKVITAPDTPERIGRLLQRLIEIETYRVLTLIAWPDVQALGPHLNEIDAEVAGLAGELGDLSGLAGEKDRKLLARLTDLARELESIAARMHFRLNASLAYSELVERRLEEVREERLEGYQRVSSLVNRRLRPAARTYRAILVRQTEMSERISRTSDLLRSRIDVELAHQNQKLLASMDRRSDLQLRLQQTVEGLSVVAISYYAIGILSYAAAALTELVPGMDTKLVVGLAVPVVVLVVFWFIRRVRHAFEEHGEG